MKTVYICTDCGSDKVQAKAWVSLNDLTDIDFSASESGDSSDYWCKNCEEHSKCEKRTFFEENDEVNWTDPEGISSGIYRIIKKISEDDENSIYLISNGFSEVEVYEHELK